MRRALPLLIFAALAACSGPEKTARYAIDPPAASKHLPNRIGSAELREVSLPQYAAGQEIAFQTEDGALRSTPKNVWADDPARAVTLALAQQISTLSGATVIAEPWPLTEPAAHRIEVRVQSFMPRADGIVELTGQYFVTPEASGGGDVVRRFAILQPLEGEGPPAIAVAQSRAVQKLAEQIARLD